MRQTRKIRSGVVAIICVLGLVSCSSSGGDKDESATPDVAALSSTTETDCEFETTGLEPTPTCYAVSVPEDWANPDPDDQVVLQVAVFSATDEATTVDDPMIYLDGGPGGETLKGLLFTQDLLIEPYVAERDVIVFDQRGVGYSEPNLACEEETELFLKASQGEIPDDKVAQESLTANQQCHDRLVADGVNVADYNSVASAHDVEAIRHGLKYDELNLLGVSYGTRLAQTLMRLYPTSLRSVVLDSVVPVAADIPELLEPHAERSLRLVFDACAADAECSDEYPTFEDDYFALLDQLDTAPAEVEVNDLDGNEYTFVVDGDDLVNLTFSALYDKTMFASLPQLVAESEDGDYALIGQLSTLNLVNSQFFTAGMHYSVECHEEVAFSSIDDLKANQPTEAPFNRFNALDEPLNYFDICEQWDAGAAPAVENEVVNSDIPTLLLTGTFDPITPPSYAEQVAEHLGNSTLVEFPTEGHGVAPSECGSEIVAAFFDDPSSAPDAACVTTVEPPSWVVGGGEINLVPFESALPKPLTGVRPEGWDEQGPGVYVRQQSLSDPTLVVMQATGGVGPELLLGSLGEQLGVELDELDPTDIDGAEWRTFGGEQDGATYRLLFSPDNELLVLFSATNDEFDDLYQSVALAGAASLKAG